jgi:hypothetical protein
MLVQGERREERGGGGDPRREVSVDPDDESGTARGLGAVSITLLTDVWVRVWVRVRSLVYRVVITSPWNRMDPAHLTDICDWRYSIRCS